MNPHAEISPYPCNCRWRFVTRRDFLWGLGGVIGALALLAGFAEAKDDAIVLKNRSVLREFRRDGEVWRTVRFARADGSDALNVASDEFDILLLDNTELTIDDYRVRGQPLVARHGATQEVEFVYEPRRALPAAAPKLVTLEYSLADEPYLRKRLTLEMGDGQAIDRLEVERFATNTKATRGGRGEPVFVGDTWFFGLEFPAGQTRHSDSFAGRPYDKVGNFSWVNLGGRDAETHSRPGLVTLMHFPGFAPPGKSEIVSKTAVAGVGRKGDPIELAFRDYFEIIRRPARSFVHYNNWFDGSGKDIRPANFVDRVYRDFKTHLEPFGVRMDAMVPDNGWQNSRSVWQPSPHFFPRGLADIEALGTALERDGSHLGLWIAANGCQLDIDWGVKNGYAEARRSDAFQSYYRTFCVVAPKYRAAMFEAFKDLVTAGRLNYIKHDFNTMSCTGDGHGHLATDRHGHEANVDVMTDLLAYERELNPGIFQNFTNWMWFSPWWLQHADTVWMLSDDSGLNRKWPQLATSGMATSYRDSHLHKVWGDPATRPLVPISALMTHGIIYATGERDADKGETPHDWADYVTMYCSRGVQLKELYITPSLLSATQWDILGTTLRWANDNAAVLANSVLIGGNPTRGETIGYVSWKDDRALLALRNADAREQTIDVPFNRSVFYRGPFDRPFHARVIYPYAEEMPTRFTSGQPMRFTLPAFTTMIVELHPGNPAAKLVVTPPPPPAPRDKIVTATGFAFTFAVPDEAMQRCDLLLIGDSAQPTITLDGRPVQPHRTNRGDGWTMASYDLRAMRGKTVRVSAGATSADNQPFTEFDGGRVRLHLIADRPVAETATHANEHLPWPALRGFRRQSVELIGPTELRVPPGGTLTADQLRTITAAKLRIVVFGSNGEPQYRDKFIYLNGEKLFQVPVNRGGDQWEQIILDLPRETLAKLKLSNELRLTTSGGDSYKFKSLALAVQLPNGQWVQSATDAKVHCSVATWAYAEGAAFQDEQSAPITLTFR